MITAVVVVAGLYYGRDVIIPLVLAILFSFLLSTPVMWLERLKLGRTLSVVLVLSIAFSTLGAVLWMGTEEVAGIALRLPEFQQNIRKKLATVQKPSGSGLVSAAAALSQISKQMNAPAVETTTTQGHGQKVAASIQKPVPVEIVKPQAGLVDSLGVFGGSVVHGAATAFAVVILTLFLMLRRGDLRDRLFRLFGNGQLNLMTTAADDAANRVSRYLLTQSCVNSSFGLLFGCALYGIGVPYAAFWGAAAALLRFVPYVGTMVAGLAPFVLSLAVFSGWKAPLLTLGSYVLIEGTISAVVEPWIYATRTGISSLAILISAAFWTALWGPIGLVIATPMTVCLVVLGRYLPPLEFLFILLGDEPALSPEACYYQRLLAQDDEEARDVAEEYLKEHPRIELYDEVLVPALALAEQDRRENKLDEERYLFIQRTTEELIEELPELRKAEAEAARTAEPEGSGHVTVTCVPARDESDAVVANMLAQLLRERGRRVEAIPIGTVESMLNAVSASKPDVLVVSALPPSAVNHARALCRRIRRRLPDLNIVVGLWGPAVVGDQAHERLGSGYADHIVRSLMQAELQLRLIDEQMSANTQSVGASAEDAAPEPADAKKAEALVKR